MLFGQMLSYHDTAPVYTPVISRRGQKVVFTVEILQVSTTGTPKLTVIIQHKKSTQTGGAAGEAWSDKATLANQVTAAGPYTMLVEDVYNELRLKFLLNFTNTAAWMRVAALDPVWE